MTTCTVCRMPLPGSPDADVTCAECEDTNFGGDPLRQPPKQQRHLRPWSRRELPPRRDGLRALTFVQGPWTWSPDDGVQERGDG